MELQKKCLFLGNQPFRCFFFIVIKHFNIKKTHINRYRHDSLEKIAYIWLVLSYEYGIIKWSNILLLKYHIYMKSIWQTVFAGSDINSFDTIIFLLCSWSPLCSAGAVLPLCTTAPWGTPSSNWWFTHWILLVRVRALQCLNPHNDNSLSKHRTEALQISILEI